MKRVTIQSIELTNFKGIAHLSRRFDSDRELVEAKTGSGKTSIMYAWFWALGCEVPDVIPKFNNKEVHRLDTSVEVMIQVDELSYTFKRTQVEKWKVNRDTDQEEKETNESTYWIDGIAYAAKKYQARVAEIFGVTYDKLEMLCNKDYFNADRQPKWTWKERRRELFAISNTDDIIRGLADKECYSLIAEDLRKGTTTADLRRAKKRGLSECGCEKETNLALLQDKQNDLQVYGEYDFPALEVLRTELERQINEMSVKIVKADSDADKKRISDEISLLVDKRAQLEISDKNEKMRLSNEITRLKLKLDQIALECKKLREKKELQSNLTSELLESEAVQWNGETTCPTCKQPLPAESIQSAQKAFNDNKAREQEGIRAELEKMRIELANYEQRLDALRKDYSETEQEWNLFVAENNEFVPNSEIVKISDDIDRLKTQLVSLQTDGTVNSNQEQLTELKERLRAVNEKLAYKTVVADYKKRIEKLSARNRDITDTEIVLKEAVAQIDAYINEQINLITTSINKLFTDGISFSLFSEQYANAESVFKETCVCMLNEKVFTSLSTGEAFIANLRVVEALQRAYDVCLPIFFDEAQSYTEPFTAGTQIIELRSTPGMVLSDCILFKNGGKQ